ncbi:hypothetical protein Zmor_000137 [Zophobas morio]|uniref:Uncharacterized protein n=1 Tax=Zophobas morio TaxID=2755281 RepID=A0AA38MQ84_9CUCU|nr:hypothetical protein Zmor_000137 [Zophobas morio]
MVQTGPIISRGFERNGSVIRWFRHGLAVWCECRSSRGLFIEFRVIKGNFRQDSSPPLGGHSWVLPAISAESMTMLAFNYLFGLTRLNFCRACMSLDSLPFVVTTLVGETSSAEV